jgi:hypothetical protein
MIWQIIGYAGIGLLVFGALLFVVRLVTWEPSGPSERTNRFPSGPGSRTVKVLRKKRNLPPMSD